MPILLVALAALLLLTFLLLAIPLSLFLSYRAGKARRLARRWMTTTNLVSLGISTGLFFIGAAVTSIWVVRALPYAALGLLAGGLLGFFGLTATRWDMTPRGLWYTPNRWLVLLVTFVVTARVGYGLWRVWHVWRQETGQEWLDAFGMAESLAAGGLVLGYYLVYFIGVRRRLSGRKLVLSGD